MERALLISSELFCVSCSLISISPLIPTTLRYIEKTQCHVLQSVPVAQAEAIVHRHAEYDRIKVGVLPDHIQVVSHRVRLLNGVMNQKNSTGDKLLRVKLVKIVQLPFFVGIHKHQIERSLKLWHLRMGIAPDESDSL